MKAAVSAAKDKKSQIVVYGSSLYAYSTITFMLNQGVVAENIRHVAPPGSKFGLLPELTDLPDGNLSETCFEDFNVALKVKSKIRESMITETMGTLVNWELSNAHEITSVDVQVNL